MLLPQHRELVEASGISKEIATARGYFSASEPKELIGMFPKAQQLAPALVIPIFDVWGEKALFQLRPDTPRVVNHRICKYETPRGSGLTIDVPPSTRQHLGNPKVPLVITEGVRKADAAASIGLRAIDLLGVWGFRGRNEDGGITALDAWNAIALNDGRPVYVCFDSDAMTKSAVHGAVVALGRFLEHRGAKVRIIYLPHGEDGSKVGLDDFLAAGHTREDLLALASDTLRPLGSDPRSNGKPPEGPLLPTEELLAAVAEVLDRYVRLPSRRAALAIALWTLHTWALDGAHATPYLVIQSPTKRSGKTRLQETLELLVRDPWRIAAASESAMFRKIEDQRPTLILDEVDAIFGGRSEGTEGLRAVLNAGNRPGAAVARVVGEGANLKTVDFSVYSPKSLCGIATDRWPDTILDRSIRITLKRKTKGESVARFRHRKAYAETEALRVVLAVWAAEHTQALHDAEPELPLELDDRAAEGWEALFAIADLAGAKFAEQARLAAVGLAKDAPEDEDGHGVLLLKTLKDMFGAAPALHTEAILGNLNDGDELPFGGYRKGLGIDSRGLAKLLRPFGIKPKTLRFGEVTVKGYSREEFSDAWERYCTDTGKGAKHENGPGSESLSVTTVTTAPQSQKPPIPDPSQTADVTDGESAANPHSNADVTDVTDRNGQPGAEPVNEPIVAALQAQLGGKP
jgi:hypothetical protein